MAPCEFEKILGRYLDGELPQAQRARVEIHLRDCASCAAELDQLAAISRTLRLAPLPRASGAFLARLEALADRVEDVSAFRFVIRLTAAAAAIFIVATVQWSLHRTPALQPTVTTAYSSTEKAMIDPESAIPAVASNSAADPQLDFIVQGLTGGRP
ncbi:MAG TPA: zf-HC2 domain-containing protein [Tepidisphaeraceae bacterium]|nr:zf-HC2 domain-containing protein [Tepidisphaeraceae bacterium]